jgi:hypothetical protein
MFDSDSALQMAMDRSVADRANLPTTAAVRSRRLAIAALLSLLVGATLYQGSASVRSSGLPVRSGSSSREALSSLPMAAQGTISATLGADDRAYRVSAFANGFQAQSPAQRLHIRFASSGVQIASGKVELGLSLRAMGYGASPQALDAVTPSANGSRVSYLHAGLSEWYANGPLGLEQGFTIPHAPSGHPTGPLTLAMALSGNAHASLASGGQSLTLSHAGGPSLRYAGLTTSDARGRTLDSWFELAPGRLLIHVDDRGAVYPLKVDPFVQQAELTASDGAGEDGLGFSVAVSGNTIVAGAPSHEVGANEKQGAVYVFRMPASGWANATQSAKLTASDGTEADELGYSVAASGSTIVAGARFHRVGVNTRQGAAYVYTMPAAGWANATETAELAASDGAEGDQLGYSVAASGSTIVAGAPLHIGANGEQGVAYVSTNPPSALASGPSSILPLPVSPVPPTISSVHQSHSTWRRGGKLAQISAKKKVPVGTTFSFSLNVPAAISFNFTQRVSGRKVRGTCRAQTKKNRRRPGCKRAVTAGTLSFIGRSGTNKVAFQGRISGSNRLKPGHYTLLISAANSAGHSSPRQLTFTIVK